jgi:hypothetical protein
MDRTRIHGPPTCISKGYIPGPGLYVRQCHETSEAVSHVRYLITGDGPIYIYILSFGSPLRKELACVICSLTVGYLLRNKAAGL